MEAALRLHNTLKVVHRQSEDLRNKLAKEMSALQVLDKIFDLRQSMLHNRRLVKKSEYNWWVDVYNFKRGTIILKHM
ncbi:MAG TPA: hypothetical protein VD794_00085 [Flavisolibacter sp.]|nr:hypothetical protein [Flavisolibacter sp.]